jgi:hypothetical protein
MKKFLSVTYSTKEWSFSGYLVREVVGWMAWGDKM